MGEPKDVWADRVKLLRPYQVNAALMKASGNPAVEFMHCLPAFHDPNTTVGREIMEHTIKADVFGSEASHVFDQAENRLYTIKAVLVATLGWRYWRRLSAARNLWSCLEPGRDCPPHGSAACRARCSRSASATNSDIASVRLLRSVFVSPWAQTERHTATCGGTGGSAAGSPSRSTCSQVSARASSVLMPVISERAR